MDPGKRLDEHKLIAALLTDLHRSHGSVFNTRALRLTLQKVDRRVQQEGLGFLTKTLPKLGKAFDKAIAGEQNLSANRFGFKSLPGSELPMFMGEFFKLVLDSSGTLLPDACADHVRAIRQVCYLFYKYKLPYTAKQEQAVIDKFVKTDQELSELVDRFATLSQSFDSPHTPVRHTVEQRHVARKARILLSKVFSGFDFRNIQPRHGPGAVATRQQLWAKYRWTNVSNRIRSVYPLDEYFYASLGHVCDTDITKVGDSDLPAKVILVPKDSRGPRLISCEPVDFQWIQQGIMRSLVQHIETLPLTRYNVFFTDQLPNGRGALLGSETGRYATLDLNEASDRVSVELVRLLFPSHVVDVLENCRTVATELPNGDIVKLQKFAPMGSALCFPVLALTVWSILTAAAPDEDTRESILVYGDDVIVPTAYADEAMKQLESFGLKVNRDKSCVKGFFRESCGVDAFKGAVVTPLRIRAVWSHHRSAETYTAWVSYANSCYERRYFECYDLIVGMLGRCYGAVPDADMSLTCPSLIEVPDKMRPKKSRINHKLQKKQWLVWSVRSPRIVKEMDGWSMLLRFFAEAGGTPTKVSPITPDDLVRRDPSNADPSVYTEQMAFSVRSYTRRRTSMLVRRWL